MKEVERERRKNVVPCVEEEEGYSFHTYIILLAFTFSLN